MTAYEQGFLTKCAEYGFDGSEMLKIAKGWNSYSPDDYNRAVSGRMRQINEAEGLRLDPNNLPGTMVSRGFMRMFHGNGTYGQWLAQPAPAQRAPGNPVIHDFRGGSGREPLSGANRGQQMGATSLNAQNNYGQGWGRGFVPGPQDYERQGMRQMNRPTPAPSWQTNLPKPGFVPAV